MRFPQRVFYGRPDWAERVRYLDWLYPRHTQRKPYNNLELSLLAASLDYPILRYLQEIDETIC